MQILWAFRYNPLARTAAQKQARKLPRAISWAHNCCFSNYALQPGGGNLRSKLSIREALKTFAL
ncbi:MAG: hypothetical protein LBK44_04200 [Spirochaetales bacterium]|nr:hypothetical protein [Spirochaetales bacterium]